MRISHALATLRPFFSFEFFPPRDDDGVRALLATVEALAPLRPAFVSVTYGAAGSTRDRSVAVAKEIQARSGIAVMAHVTCVGSTRRQLRLLFDDLARAGIENVLALRGDVPRDADYKPGEDGFSSARDLIAMLKKNYNFCIGAACYPEVHPDAASPQADLAYLKEKVEAGAEFLISQLFFDNARWASFTKETREIGIAVPMLPGIMPVTNASQIKRFTSTISATIPPKLVHELETRAAEAKAVEDLGVAYAAVQAAELLQWGVPGVHFFTLNKSPATRAIVSALIASSVWRPTFAIS